MDPQTGKAEPHDFLHVDPHEFYDKKDSKQSDDTGNPEEIRHEIDHTRQDMGYTLDAIKEHLAPQRLVQKAQDTAKEAAFNQVQSIANTLRNTTTVIANLMLGAIRQNPILAIVTALGLGWFLMRLRNRPYHRSIQR